MEKTALGERIKEKVNEMLLKEKREIEDLIVFIDHNDRDHALTLASNIESHLKRIGEVEVNVNDGKSKDKIKPAIDYTEEIVREVKEALNDGRKGTPLEKLELELLQGVKRIRMAIKEKQ